MPSELEGLVPAEAIIAARDAVSLAYQADGESDDYQVARAAVEAAAPLIVAAACQQMIDEAFPNGDEGNYFYGCEHLLDLVQRAASVLRGEGPTE